MSVFVLILAIIAIILSFAAKSIVLVASSAALILIFAILSLFRERLYRVSVDELLAEEAKGELVVRLAEKVIGTEEQKIKQEALRYKINSLEWQNDILRQQRSIVDSLTVRSNKEEQEANFYTQALIRALSRFRAVLAAIVVRDQLGEIQILALAGLEEKRAQVRLKEHYSKIWHAGVKLETGFCDLEHQSIMLNPLSRLGIGSLIQQPLKLSIENARLEAVLCLAYDRKTAPFKTEVQEVEQFAIKLERDISARQELKELSDKVQEVTANEQEKQHFISHMSHDIKSPLNNIRSILQLWQLEGFAGDSVELLQIALYNCENLYEIVEDIMDYSRHRAGRLSAKQQQVDSFEVIEQVVKSFEVSAKLKGLELKLFFEEVPALVEFDKGHLRRVLCNLISNAIKYTSSGSVTVRVKAMEQDGSHVQQIAVSDTGYGISQAHLQELFTPFKRFAPSKAEGVGLGLAMTKVLVELNGGVLSVASRLHHGSTFTVSAPLSREAVVATEEKAGIAINGQEEQKVESLELFSKLKVLIVDDDPDCVETLARSLNLYGLNVLKATSVYDALSICNFGMPDFIISDATMPEGGGQRIVEQVSKSEALQGIMILSGNSSLSDSEEFYRLGAAKVMLKPAEITDIVEWIQKTTEHPEEKVSVHVVG